MEKELKQPDWCCYPDATFPISGCWSLVGGYVTGEDYCKKCDCYKNKKHDKERNT